LRQRPAEPLVVWLLFGLVAVEVFVTYGRLPARDLYNVSGSGVEGGASRALVFLNYPVALAALGVLGTVAPELGRRSRALAAVAAVLCAAVFWPGVVSPSDLDARPVNAVAAVGVALAVLLSLGRSRPLGHVPGDRGRLLVAAVLFVLSLPWLAAELGLSFGGIPVLGQVFQTSELRHQPGVPGLHAAVHHGFHHGLGGALLVVTALLLSRALRPGHLHGPVAGLLALLAAYGLMNVANDAWLEQVVKRGWTAREIPSVLYPAANWGWAAIIVLAAWLWWGWLRRVPARNAASPRRSAPASGTRG
jgi:hypothetical protein